MAKGYWIVRVDIDDPEAYKKYVAANGKPLAAYGARFVVRGAPFENAEGTARQRNAVIEFPSFEAARDCYHSPEYQAVIGLRTPVSTADIIIIEGYDGPQPS
jgi:uncharacterized protein (DUF1330 family)